jgi:uncharacterized protein (TIGR02996 family)
MTDGDLLLARVIADPACDAVRLVYADWLQENGQPERAEFVRVQVELARTPEPREIEKDYGTRHARPVCIRCDEGACRYHDLRRRERELWSLLPPEAFLDPPA